MANISFRDWDREHREKIRALENNKLDFKAPTDDDMFGGLQMTSNTEKCICEYTECSELFGKLNGVLVTNSYGGKYRIKKDGTESSENVENLGVRPKIQFSKIYKYAKLSSKDPNEDIQDPRMKKEYFEVTFGEYIQRVLNDNDKNNLEKLLQNNELVDTNKNYIYGNNDKAKCFKEYYYEGKKYARTVDDKGNIYWVEVLPIVWQVDLKKDIAISKKVLFGGVDIKGLDDYMSKYFSKDIIPSNYPLLNEEENNEYVDQVRNYIYSYYNQEKNKYFESSNKKHKLFILIEAIILLLSILPSIVFSLPFFLSVIIFLIVEAYVFTEHDGFFKTMNREMDSFVLFKELAGYYGKDVDKTKINTKDNSLVDNKKEVIETKNVPNNQFKNKSFDEKINLVLKSMSIKCENLPIEYKIGFSKRLNVLNDRFYNLVNKEINDKYSDTISLNEINKEKLEVYRDIFTLNQEIEKICNWQKELEEAYQQSMEIKQLLEKNVQDAMVLRK